MQKGTALARPELGHSVHVEVAGLEPGREYWYRFHAGDEVSQIGRTKTAPPAGAAGRSAALRRLRLQPLRGRLLHRVPAHRRRAVRLRLPHRRLHLRRARRRRPDDRRLRQHNGDEIYTLVDYRNRYALYKIDRDLMAAHASAPLVVTWDDHEVDNNYAGDIDENDTPPEIFVLRRAAAYQAYYEAMPLRASALPSGSHMRLYRRLQFGSLIDLSVLDTRQWRSDQPCGDGSRPTAPDALAPTRTMLGAEQEKWLFDNLATREGDVDGDRPAGATRSRYDRAKANPDGQFSMDKWDGYVAARQRLYNRLLETHAPNPIVLSGDVHQHYGADLKIDFTDPRSRDRRRRVHQHGGHDDRRRQRGRRDVGSDQGRQPAHQVSTATGAATSRARRRRAQMRADFKVLDKVSVPDLPVRVGGSLVVEAGRPGSNTD